ncbi:diguanylate cyclase (GGDEF)-like protein [Halopolyspora algeriensis]|uniref:Diguanylate cyclase (GGDEF)-like protein n=1 Tax=Halopolyspora algeriensis TaxID=1500506 RepID=A0A368W2U2_9ACTN|nr:GGDEF domain-containing protein [Halopolyspora algeriensis]RCW47003.1 diguanylate cyclase (GGDEF)-like protein [Halopolyspora algeriensis]TQM48091.1 diguanylate cyclase (GGDEF)-like protein [Halopolyspora algeriensis]
MDDAEMPVSGCEAALDEIRRRARDGNDEGAITLASAVANRARDPHVVGTALMLRLGASINLGRLGECPALLDRAFEVLEGTREYALVGGVHALASFVAAQSSPERCVRHLVQGRRALDKVHSPGVEAVEAWHNLAVSFSYAGFHAQAMDVAERGYLIGQAIGLSSGEHALPEIAVRRAVSLDHRGDTESCARLLHEVLETWSQRTTPSGLRYAEQHYYRYATTRLAALGEDVTPIPALPAADSDGWELEDLRLLAGACSAIAEGHPRQALNRLADRHINPYTLGAAELHRVRALAHAADGDHRAAWSEDRQAMRRATEVADLLREQLIDGTRVQLDHESLRRTVEQYASEALTDPLTGLPNRRHFDRWVAGLAEQNIRTAVGIIDLNDFKTVNTVHGHLGGDLVLQRTAAVLARTVRGGDFVARYGGDEFIVALPHTDPATAHDLGDRLIAAVAEEEWEALVTGTPVSITIGWGELTDIHDVACALEHADRAMLTRKDSLMYPYERSAPH